MSTRSLLAAAALIASGLAVAAPTTSAHAGTNGCPPNGNFYGVAHMGAHDMYQYRTWRNVVPAFVKAQERCQWVESDVRFTSDGIAVMIHDQTTGPMFRQRCNLEVATHTLAELRAACTNPDGSTVATFDQFLDVIDTVRGMVEIKPGATSDAKVRELIGQIYAHNDEGRVSLEFTDETVLDKIARLDDNARPITRVWKRAPAGDPARVAAHSEYAVLNWTKVTSAMVSRLAQYGVKAIAGGSSGATTWNQLAASGYVAGLTDDSWGMFGWQNSR